MTQTVDNCCTLTHSNTVKVLLLVDTNFHSFSTKCIDPWVLEFMISNITSSNQWKICISLLRNQRKLEPHDKK
jgi:hypothetical protein